MEQIGGAKPQSTPSEFIASSVIYDMIQITNILTGGNPSTRSLEATGLVLTSSPLLPSIGCNFLDRGFEALEKDHRRGAFKSVAQQLLDLGKTENPIEITAQEKESGKVISSTKLQRSLSLPAFLKISENPLFEEYAAVMYRYAIIISKADNVVTKAEERLLKTFTS